MSKRTKRPDLYPTRKWWATQISGVATLATAWVSTGGWSKPLTMASIGLVSQAVVVYLVPNGTPASSQESAPRVRKRHHGALT